MATIRAARQSNPDIGESHGRLESCVVRSEASEPSLPQMAPEDLDEATGTVKVNAVGAGLFTVVKIEDTGKNAKAQIPDSLPPASLPAPAAAPVLPTTAERIDTPVTRSRVPYLVIGGTIAVAISTALLAAYLR